MLSLIWGDDVPTHCIDYFCFDIIVLHAALHHLFFSESYQYLHDTQLLVGCDAVLISFICQ